MRQKQVGAFGFGIYLHARSGSSYSEVPVSVSSDAHASQRLIGRPQRATRCPKLESFSLIGTDVTLPGSGTTLELSSSSLNSFYTEDTDAGERDSRGRSPREPLPERFNN